MRTAAEIRKEMQAVLYARWQAEHIDPMPYGEVVDAILNVVAEQIAISEEVMERMTKAFGLK